MAAWLYRKSMAAWLYRNSDGKKGLMLEMESRSYEYFLPKHKKNAIILHSTVGATVKFLLCCVQHPKQKIDLDRTSDT